MAEESNTLPNQKVDYSYVSNPLSPQEIELLKKDMEEAFRRFDELSEIEFQKARKDSLKPNADR